MELAYTRVRDKVLDFRKNADGLGFVYTRASRTSSILFLHDASVPSLDKLLDRGRDASHPFYLADPAQRKDRGIPERTRYAPKVTRIQPQTRFPSPG